MLNDIVKSYVVAVAFVGVAFGGFSPLSLAQESPLTMTLRESPTPGTLLDVHFQDAQQGWIVGAGGTMLQTKDGGNDLEKGSTSDQRLTNGCDVCGCSTWLDSWTKWDYFSDQRWWCEMVTSG